MPYLDQRKIRVRQTSCSRNTLAEQFEQALRRLFWEIIVNNKSGLGEETTFDFKYIPDLLRKTQMEDGLEPGLRNAGIEYKNLQALDLFVLVGLFALKIVAIVYRAIE